jgi:hypothetical protein
MVGKNSTSHSLALRSSMRDRPTAIYPTAIYPTAKVVELLEGK